jgi:hypothetical protein
MMIGEAENCFINSLKYPLEDALMELSLMMTMWMKNLSRIVRISGVAAKVSF